MPSVDAGDLKKALRALGAEEDVKRRHVFYKLRIGGVVVRSTMLSHGESGAIGQPLLGLIARQMGVTSAQLVELVKGNLSPQEYFQIVAAGIEPVEAEE